MNKILLLIATWSLVTTAFNIGTNVNAHETNTTSPHVDSKLEFPNTRWATVRQTVQIHVPLGGQALIQLSIDIPDSFSFQTSKVEVTDRNRIVSARTSRQGQRLQIDFNQPISANTNLRIDLNSVQRSMSIGSSTYYFYGKTIDGVTNFLGEAYFPRSN
jgi:Protein of unknown function (DUF2808)